MDIMNSTKHILQKIIVNNYSYAILRPFIYLAERIKASRKNYVDKQQLAGFKLKAENIFADGIVKHGPVTGMKRSGTGSGASSNYAKLLGSYEKELHPFLAQIIEIPFSQIINIGSDDGYYAIGLALKMPQAQVTAFDINKKARELTQLNARLNQVGNLAVAGKFSADELTKQVA